MCKTAHGSAIAGTARKARTGEPNSAFAGTSKYRRCCAISAANMKAATAAGPAIFGCTGCRDALKLGDIRAEDIRNDAVRNGAMREGTIDRQRDQRQ